MYGKIIRKNVGKNIKDYSVYFLTLLIVVAVFYAFNAIESQPAFQETAQSGTSISHQVVSMIGIVSKFIAIFLAFLIIYANNFLLRRRKKELGIYMILGMSERKISTMFVGETILIGILAIISGIGVGCLLSQVISVLALKLFAYDMSSYRFVFSAASLKETIICFIIIFAVVVLFNIRTISKVKLIDMLNASRKNEAMTVEKTGMLGLLILCAGVLYGVCAYLVYKGNGLSFTSNQVSICALAICVATAMLVYGLAGLVLNFLRKRKSWYLKDVNAFFIRQISSKVQTNFVTMTVVSLLLTGTICVLALGIGMADSMNGTVKEAAPYDLVLLEEEIDQGTRKEEFYQQLKGKGLSLDEALGDSYIIDFYETEQLRYKQMLSDTENLPDIVKNLPESTMPILSITDYNNALRLQGKEPIELEENSYLLNSKFNVTDENLEKKYKEKPVIEIGEFKLKPGLDTVLHNVYYTNVVGINDSGTIIVPDKVVESLKKTNMALLGVYKKDYDESGLMKEMMPFIGDPKSTLDCITKSLVCGAYYDAFAMAAFICCYLGIIFLIICVTILSLQQMTETEDNVKRYQLLKKLGVENKVCCLTLFKQILIYFGVPLIVAIIYSIVVLPKAAEKLQYSLGMEVGTQVTFIVVLMIIIYGGYFLMTYLFCKRMLREKKDYRMEE